MHEERQAASCLCRAGAIGRTGRGQTEISVKSALDGLVRFSCVTDQTCNEKLSTACVHVMENISKDIRSVKRPSNNCKKMIKLAEPNLSEELSDLHLLFHSVFRTNFVANLYDRHKVT